MKNVINYYYDIIVNEFKKSQVNFTFVANDNEYEFIPYYGDTNKLINIYSILKFYRKEIYEIIINKKGSIITYYEDKPYILLKKNNFKSKKIELIDIINYSTNVYIKEEINWKKLWIGKLDYYEIQLEEIGLKYPTLKKSFAYYLGLSEAAINLLNYVDMKNVGLYISHRRLDKIEDMYNPLNVIIDSRVRNIAEYIKSIYFFDCFSLMDIKNKIMELKFSKEEIILLLSRLLYPSYYFDLYEKIFISNESEKELNKIIKKNAEYEAFLRDIYYNLKQYYTIPQIEFLEY